MGKVHEALGQAPTQEQVSGIIKNSLLALDDKVAALQRSSLNQREDVQNLTNELHEKNATLTNLIFEFRNQNH